MQTVCHEPFVTNDFLVTRFIDQRRATTFNPSDKDALRYLSNSRILFCKLFLGMCVCMCLLMSFLSACSRKTPADRGSSLIREIRIKSFTRLTSGSLSSGPEKSNARTWHVGLVLQSNTDIFRDNNRTATLVRLSGDVRCTIVQPLSSALFGSGAPR